VRYVGFVKLPIEGDPAENLRRALDQIESALVELHADNVERIDNRIRFSAGFFSFKRWAGPHPLAFVTSGEIEVEPSGDCLLVDYRLSFWQQFIMWAVIVLLSATRIRFRASDQPLTTTLILLAIAWLAFAVGGAASAVFRFSRFLRQFPREDRAEEQVRK
jgi:hypothetical protein